MKSFTYQNKAKWITHRWRFHSKALLKKFAHRFIRLIFVHKPFALHIQRYTLHMQSNALVYVEKERSFQTNANCFTTVSLFSHENPNYLHNNLQLVVNACWIWSPFRVNSPVIQNETYMNEWINSIFIFAILFLVFFIHMLKFIVFHQVHSKFDSLKCIT